MKKLILITILFCSCQTEEPKVNPTPSSDPVMDSLMKYKDSLELDLYDFEKHISDSTTDYLLKH